RPVPSRPLPAHQAQTRLAWLQLEQGCQCHTLAGLLIFAANSGIFEPAKPTLAALLQVKDHFVDRASGDGQARCEPIPLSRQTYFSINVVCRPHLYTVSLGFPLGPRPVGCPVGAT